MEITIGMSKRTHIDSDDFVLEVEVDEKNIPDSEKLRRKDFTKLKDLMNFYSMIDEYGDDESTFTFVVTLFDGKRRTVKGEDLDRVIICKELFCYVFIYKNGYIELATGFKTIAN